jgi:diaminohydroxyphosphoribosylaminopyrimidine deaminase/5-amino-6-(5-phosphoribosylamino)uracil reductase
MSLKHSTHGTADSPGETVADAVAVAGFSAAEVAAMDAALAAARQGPRGANPLVGAVVIGADGTRIVTGHHRGAGTAHAEADAIDQAKAAGLDLSGTTMVVTLEPCNHSGRTGPCAQAIIGAGITDVVYAIDDPHDPAVPTAKRPAGSRCAL